MRNWRRSNFHSQQEKWLLFYLIEWWMGYDLSINQSNLLWDTNCWARPSRSMLCGRPIMAGTNMGDVDLSKREDHLPWEGGSNKETDHCNYGEDRWRICRDWGGFLEIKDNWFIFLKLMWFLYLTNCPRSGVACIYTSCKGEEGVGNSRLTLFYFHFLLKGLL